jgi:hypothetical protein
MKAFISNFAASIGKIIELTRDELHLIAPKNPSKIQLKSIDKLNFDQEIPDSSLLGKYDKPQHCPSPRYSRAQSFASLADDSNISAASNEALDVPVLKHSATSERFTLKRPTPLKVEEAKAQVKKKKDTQFLDSAINGPMKTPSLSRKSTKSI